MKKITLFRRKSWVFIFLLMMMSIFRANVATAQLGDNEPAKDITIRVLDENGDGIKGITVMIIDAAHPCDCDPYNGDKCLLNVVKSKESAKDGWVVFDAKDLKPNTKYVATINASCNKIGDCKTGGDKDCKFDPGSDEEFTTNKIGGYNKGIPLTKVTTKPNIPGGPIKSGVGMGGKTLFGSVSEDEGFKKTIFNTPNGSLNLYTTADQDYLKTGKSLTGTVTAEPAGNTQEEKNRNLDKLKKLSLKVGETTIAILGTEQLIKYTGRRDQGNNFCVSLTDPSNTDNKEMISWMIPDQPVQSYAGTGPAPSMFMNKNIVLGENMIALHTLPRADAGFQETDRFAIVDSRGRNFQTNPYAQSPSTTVLMIPDGAAKGPITVSRTRNGKQIDKLSFFYADISLSSPNTNLKSGEKSFIVTQIITGDDRQTTQFPSFEVDIRNFAPEVMNMEGGNMQRYRFPINNQPKNSGDWAIKETITGVRPGQFTVNASLHEDFNSCKDAFAPQKHAIQNPYQFNRWVNALKTDLANYAKAQPNDARGMNGRANIARAISNIPECLSTGMLGECKMLTDRLLLPLNIPQGAAISWLSSFEALKISADQLDAVVGGHDGLVEWPVMKNGLHFVDQLAAKWKDTKLQKDCKDLLEQIYITNPDDLDKPGRKKTNDNLKTILRECEPRINSSTVSLLSYGMSDLTIATKNLGIYQNVMLPLVGINLFSVVSANDFVKKPYLFDPDAEDPFESVDNPLHTQNNDCKGKDVFMYHNSAKKEVTVTLVVKNEGDCRVRVTVEKASFTPPPKKPGDNNNENGSTTGKDSDDNPWKKGNNAKDWKIKYTKIYDYDVAKLQGGDVHSFKIPKESWIRFSIKCSGGGNKCDFTRRFSVTMETDVNPTKDSEIPKTEVDPPTPVGKLDKFKELGNRCVSKDMVFYSITNRDVKETMKVYFKAVSECECYFEAYTDLSPNQPGGDPNPLEGGKLGLNRDDESPKIAKPIVKGKKSTSGDEQSQMVPPGKTLYIKGRCPIQQPEGGPCKGTVLITGISYTTEKK